MKHFARKADDGDIKPVIEYVLTMSERHARAAEEIFRLENFPVPKGFSAEDVKPDAPRLYSDALVLRYAGNISKLSMQAHSVGLALAIRPDVRRHYRACLQSATELDEMVVQALLAKGVYNRSPYIPPPARAEYVAGTAATGARPARTGAEPLVGDLQVSCRQDRAYAAFFFFIEPENAWRY